MEQVRQSVCREIVETIGAIESVVDPFTAPPAEGRQLRKRLSFIDTRLIALNGRVGRATPGAVEMHLKVVSCRENQNEGTDEET